MVNIRLAPFSGYHLDLRQALGLPAAASSQTGQFLPASDGLRSFGIGAFHHPYFPNRELLPERKPLVEIKVKTLLETVGVINEFDVEKKLFDLGADAIEPLIRAIQKHPASFIKRLNVGDRRRVGFKIAIRVLGELKDNRAVGHLLALLDSGALIGVELQETIGALGRIGDARAVESLIGLLRDKRYLVRREAATALGQLGDPRAIEPLEALLSDTNHEKRQETELAAALSHSDPLVRNAAAVALAERGISHSQDALLEALEDPRWSVRLSASKSLKPFEDPSQVQKILEELDSSESKGLALECIRLVEPVPGDEITQALGRVLRRHGSSNELKVRAAEALRKRGDHRNPQIFGYFIEAGFFDHCREIREWTCQQSEAGRAIADYFDRHPDSLQLDDMRDRLKKTSFPEVLEIVERFERQQEIRHREAEARDREKALLREEESRCQEEQRRLEEEKRLQEEERGALLEKTQELIETIREKISDRLGLKMDHEGFASESNGGHYGRVTMAVSMRPQLSQVMELRQYLNKVLHIEIEMGETMEELRERVRILNIVVPHETAHVIQDKLGIQPPQIDFSSLKHLNPQAAAHNANETLIDRLGFDAARRVYVSGDGDLLLDEEGREAVAIHAHAALMDIILRNLTVGLHHFSEEILARFIAVTKELAVSEAISVKMQGRLNALADELSAKALDGKSPATSAEIGSLIETYRTIFRLSELSVT